MFMIIFVYFLFLTKDFIDRCPKSILLENTLKNFHGKGKKQIILLKFFYIFHKSDFKTFLK